MGIFDKLKDKVVGGVTSGVGNAVRNTAERKTSEAVQGQVDRTADALIKTGNGISDTSTPLGADGENETLSQSGGGLAGLAGMMGGFAMNAVNEAAKNMKICPKCEEPTSADKKFCPSCGAALPEQTLAAGAVCKSCGKQNSVGERFCSDCGAKLPFAEQEELAGKERDNEVLKTWERFLPQYPKWICGGHGYTLEENGLDSGGYPYYHFSARAVSAANLAAYRTLLKQNGFRTAGEYPSEDMLYKRIDGVVYCFESAEPFCSDPGCLSVSFGVGEPRGGFDYVKPVKKENKGLFGRFKR